MSGISSATSCRADSVPLALATAVRREALHPPIDADMVDLHTRVADIGLAVRRTTTSGGLINEYRPAA
jgi:hypothetical protein